MTLTLLLTLSVRLRARTELQRDVIAVQVDITSERYLKEKVAATV
jgi:hypothetical protein